MEDFKITAAKDIPMKGIYTKTAKAIINEFERQGHQKAEVEVLKYSKNPRQLMSLYNAIKSLIKRKKLKLQVGISLKERRLYLWKV